MNKRIKDVKRVSAKSPKIGEVTKADNIRLSRGNKICMESFKETKEADGTVTILTKRVYKRPTKTNIQLVRDAGYRVEVAE